VKQTQQEYYNVYVPGALSGYPDPTSPNTFPTGEDTKTSHIVLFSDNINKVPRDLSEVGPDQKQYRSSIRLFGRVENDSATSNAQFIPTKEGFSVPTLANASDLTMDVGDIDPDVFYQLNTNPIIGRISTNGAQFGVTNTTMVPYLSVLETNPVISNIDIYWETSSTGLISELNDLIGQNFEGAYSFIDVNYSQFEWQNPNPAIDSGNTGAADSKYVTDWFYPVTYTNITLYTTTATIASVKNANGSDVTGFALESSTIGGINKYRIKITNNFYYNIATNLNQFKFILAVTDPLSSTTNNITIKGDLDNIAPTINAFTIPLLYTGTTSIYTFTGVNGSFGNVPASPPYTSTTTSDLKWTFEDGTETFTGGIGVSEFTLTINANSIPGYLAVTAGNPRTLETPTIVLTDSGNAIDIATLSLDFTPGDFDPIQFNLDFNL